jgi:hypothetical protein
MYKVLNNMKGPVKPRGVATAQKDALRKVLKNLTVPEKAAPKPANGLYARFKNLFK